MIVVCGEALIDLVAGADGKLRPEPGGGPFNTARALARLGVPASFLGRLSTDPFGRLLYDELARDGVDLSLVSRGSEPTTLAVAQLDSHHRARYDFNFLGTSAPSLTSAMVPARLEAGITALHVGSLGLVLEPIASTLFGLICRESSSRVVMLDPNVRPALITDPGTYRARVGSVVAQSTVVKASQDDVAWLYPSLELDAAAHRVLAAGPRMVVITRGAEGAIGFSGEVRVSVPAPAVAVVDTIGAGDAFGAALLAWLHEHGLLVKELALGRPELESALEFACRVASLTCTRAGADPPDRDEPQIA